jgi:two-component system response regulator DevR
MPVRVLVVDDHPVVRHGLLHLLQHERDVEVVGEAGTGADALSRVESLAPDVVLLDIRLPGPDGLEIAAQLRRRYPDVKLIILTAHRDDEYLLGALRAGAHAYLLKQASHETLADAIHRVHAGERLLSPELMSRVLEEFEAMAHERIAQQSELTDDELRILDHLAAGDTTREIAQKLHWSEATVNRRIQEILAKLGVENRTHAVAEAIRRGLV